MAKKRPNPPDRDDDGKPGGSLPGNQTATAAKGSLKRDYRTRLCAEDEAEFQLWATNYTDPDWAMAKDTETAQWDARGFWHSAIKHGEDVTIEMFRTPHHPEFSSDSRWG